VHSEPLTQLSIVKVHLEGVVSEGGHQVSKCAVVGGHALQDFTSGSKHSKTSVGNFLGLEALELVGISLLEAKRVQAEVTRSTHARLSSRSGSNSGDGLNERDCEEGGEDVLWVGIPDLPESIHLVLVCGHFTSGGRAENFDLEDTSNGKHGNTAMLELGLTEPVKVNTNLINVGETKGVETNISSHGTVKLAYERQEEAT
jgi:hypothetical protein